MATDYSPKTQIPPDLFASLTNRYTGGMGSFQDQYQKAQQNAEIQKKRAILQQLVAAMRNQGASQQGPQLPGAGMQGAPSPASGMGAPPANNQGQIMSLMAQLDPQSVIKGMMPPNPFQQSQIDLNRARTAKLNQPPSLKSGSSGGLENVSWETATPDQKALAKGIYDGNIRPYDLGYKDRSIGTMLANEYATRNKLPPFQSYSADVKAGMSKNLGFGKLGMNSLALNTALGHANSAMDAYQAVANTNQKWLNKPLNVIRKETNDPNIVKLQTTLNALSGELATVFKGSAGTDQEIGHWVNVLSQDLTPAQAQGAIQQIDELLRSRVSALEYQQGNVMGGRPSDRKLLSPHGSELMEKFKNAGKKSPVSSGWSSDKEKRLQELRAKLGS